MKLTGVEDHLFRFRVGVSANFLSDPKTAFFAVFSLFSGYVAIKMIGWLKWLCTISSVRNVRALEHQRLIYTETMKLFLFTFSGKKSNPTFSKSGGEHFRFWNPTTNKWMCKSAWYQQTISECFETQRRSSLEERLFSHPRPHEFTGCSMVWSMYGRMRKSFKLREWRINTSI